MKISDKIDKDIKDIKDMSQDELAILCEQVRLMEKIKP